jgi:nucleoside-triphosphatase
MNILITGKPGIGKTTLIKGIAQKLAKRAGGFYTEEIRKNRERIGFRIKTLDGKAGILSRMDIDSSYRIGKYRVNLIEFEQIAIPVIESSIANSKIIIIDEIGPMELLSQRFQDAILEALSSPNQVIATIKLKGPKFIDQIKSRHDVIIFNLNFNNRKEILSSILGAVLPN